MQERKIAFYTKKTASWTYLLKYLEELHVSINTNYSKYNYINIIKFKR